MWLASINIDWVRMDHKSKRKQNKLPEKNGTHAHKKKEDQKSHTGVV